MFCQKTALQGFFYLFSQNVSIMIPNSSRAIPKDGIPRHDANAAGSTATIASNTTGLCCHKSGLCHVTLPAAGTTTVTTTPPTPSTELCVHLPNSTNCDTTSCCNQCTTPTPAATNNVACKCDSSAIRNCTTDCTTDWTRK